MVHYNTISNLSLEYNFESFIEINILNLWHKMFFFSHNKMTLNVGVFSSLKVILAKIISSILWNQSYKTSLEFSVPKFETIAKISSPKLKIKLKVICFSKL